MSGYSRATPAFVFAVLSLSFIGGCGCEIYNTRVTGEGHGYAVEAPEETISLRMESRGMGPLDPRVLDASPTSDRIAVVCLSVSDPDLFPDVFLVLDYGLELGVLQSGDQAPSAFGGCNGVGQSTDPENPTMVYGSIEFEGKEVELDSIEARSTSLKPPRYDVKLGGKDAEGKAYEFELDQKLDRAGNAVFCD